MKIFKKSISILMIITMIASVLAGFVPVNEPTQVNAKESTEYTIKVHMFCTKCRYWIFVEKKVEIFKFENKWKKLLTNFKRFDKLDESLRERYMNFDNWTTKQSRKFLKRIFKNTNQSKTGRDNS